MASWSIFSAAGATMGQVRFHNEATDTLKINEVLSKAMQQYKESRMSPSALVGIIGREFLGTPYVAHTLEGDTEMLTVNMDELDCTTFVENVIALAMTVEEGRTSWRDFLYNLERLRYRGGNMDGYGSRLHYICDWISDNSHRGVLTDATPTFPGITYAVKTIDFMTSNRDRYPSLADSLNYERIKSIEGAYSNHRFPYIKSRHLGAKGIKESFRDGDIVALTTSLKNLDVTHMGIIVIKDGTPYLMHASSSHGKVEISDLPLFEFMKRNTGLTGVRVMRLK